MDTISDMFTRIMNAYKAGLESVIIPHSALKNEVLRVLRGGGFIKGIEKKGKKVRKFLEVILRYKDDKEAALSGFQRISRPSRRLYATREEVKKLTRGHGMLIVSTSKGVMAGDEAKKAGIGGEVMVRVW